MYEFPHVESYQKLRSVFDTIIKSEVPDKFTYRYLAKIGFASSKDRDIVPTLKKLGLIDRKSRPTSKYINLRDQKRFSSVLQDSIDLAYKDLFELDPNADDVSENVLNGYFSKLTGASHQECVVYTKTFLELIEIANYSSDRVEEVSKEAEQKQIATKNKLKENQKVNINQPNINLNINLPTTTDENVYKSLFKHLKDLINP